MGTDHRERELHVRVDGPLALNSVTMRVEAALAGLGLAYLPGDQVLDHAETGRLVCVLDDWLPPSPGYHLHYPAVGSPRRLSGAGGCAPARDADQ